MNFIYVHTNETHEILLNVESISHVQSINGGKSTRIALCRGDDLFVSDTYEAIVHALHGINGAQFLFCN